MVNRRGNQTNDPSKRVLNAEYFMKSLKICLMEYCVDLRQSEWESEIWVNCRKKLNYIIDNCSR